MTPQNRNCGLWVRFWRRLKRSLVSAEEMTDWPASLAYPGSVRYLERCLRKETPIEETRNRLERSWHTAA